jgi:hypothetical protein
MWKLGDKTLIFSQLRMPHFLESIVSVWRDARLLKNEIDESHTKVIVSALPLMQGS